MEVKLNKYMILSKYVTIVIKIRWKMKDMYGEVEREDDWKSYFVYKMHFTLA